MPDIFILSYLPQDETPYGMDFLTNASVHATREDAEFQAQRVYNTLEDLEDYDPKPLAWGKCNDAIGGQNSMAWVAENSLMLFLIRRSTIA